MSPRIGLLVGLILVGFGLLVYDIGLRSSGSSFTNTADDEVSEALRPVSQTLQRVDQINNCALSTETPTFEQFFDFVEESRPCESMKMFGGRGNDTTADGSKAVCMDPKFAPREKDCIVLSFGINNEWSFDDAMERHGCLVYAFDPSMGNEHHTRDKNILFYSLGLSDKDKTINIKNKQVPGEFMVRTFINYRGVDANIVISSKTSLLVTDNRRPSQVTNLRGILDRFALLETDIDYLKIDIESSELDFFKNVLLEDRELLTRVKQIGMEIHNGHLNVARRDLYWKHIHRLRCLGFRQVSSEANSYRGSTFVFGSRKVSQYYELVWINEAYL